MQCRDAPKRTGRPRAKYTTEEPTGVRKQRCGENGDCQKK